METKPIEDFPSYLATRDGQIISLRLNGPLSPGITPRGYKLVTLQDNGKSKQAHVHVIIATCFHGARPEGLVVNHKDANPSNNHADNLEWVTQSENILQSYIMNNRIIDDRQKTQCGELGKAKRQTDPLLDAQIREAYTGKRGGIQRLIEQFGLSKDVIRRIIRGDTEQYKASWGKKNSKKRKSNGTKQI